MKPADTKIHLQEKVDVKFMKKLFAILLSVSFVLGSILTASATADTTAAQDGDLVYSFNFKGESGVWTPAAVNSGFNENYTATVSSDGSSVNIKSIAGKQPTTGTFGWGAQLNGVSVKDGETYSLVYRMRSNSYADTNALSVDSFFLDWGGEPQGIKAYMTNADTVVVDAAMGSVTKNKRTNVSGFDVDENGFVTIMMVYENLKSDVKNNLLCYVLSDNGDVTKSSDWKYAFSWTSTNVSATAACPVGLVINGGGYMFGVDMDVKDVKLYKGAYIAAAGDIDGNGRINSSDILILRKYILGTSTNVNRLDVNRDGYIDLRDLVKIKKICASVVQPDPLTAMSFNLYVGDQTTQRKTSVLQTIQNKLPDTLGVQEADDSWMNYLNENLATDYASIGSSSKTTDGQYSAIFYLKEKFILLEGGTKWLSDTPNTISKYSESSMYRTFTYAVLREKKSSAKILVVNTHLDHSGIAARNKQIQVVLNFIKGYTNLPVIFTGDFNDNPTSDIYSETQQQLADSSLIAEQSEPAYTFHNYGQGNVTLDYIFVSSKHMSVLNYKVITDKANGILPSDHYPVYIKYQITA